jgi:diguanylate cyclase (GGDEF)-like protein
VETSSNERQDARIVASMLALAAVCATLAIGHRFAIGYLRGAELALLSAFTPVLGGLAIGLWRAPHLLMPIVRALGLLGMGYLLARGLNAGLAAPTVAELRIDLLHCAAWAPVVWLLLMKGFDRLKARLASLGLYVGLVGSFGLALAGPHREALTAMERFSFAEWILLSGGLFLVFLELYANAQERAAAAERAFSEARTDALTGVANRRSIEELLQRELDRASDRPAALALILVDTDHFKRINDNHGHSVGDEVLKRVATLLDDGVRTTDSVARWGGEEFLILLRRTDLKDASALAERLRESLSDHLFPQVGKVTASFGVSSPGPGDDLHAVVDRADRALYEAKESGRNRSAVSFPSLPAV